MNTIKQIFFVTVLITTYNASGMFGFGRQLTQRPSLIQQEKLSYFSLGLLHLNGEQQEEYFFYHNSEEYNNPRFKELLGRAKFNQAVKNNPKKNPQLPSLPAPVNGKFLSPSSKKNAVKLSENFIK